MIKSVFKLMNSQPNLTSGISMIYVTCPASGDATKKLITCLLENNLVACVNKISSESCASSYKWEGKVVVDDPENLLIMKTADDRIDDVIQMVKKEHPYDCPEVIAVPVTKGS